MAAATNLGAKSGVGNGIGVGVDSEGADGPALGTIVSLGAGVVVVTVGFSVAVGVGSGVGVLLGVTLGVALGSEDAVSANVGAPCPAFAS